MSDNERVNLWFHLVIVGAERLSHDVIYELVMLRVRTIAGRSRLMFAHARYTFTQFSVLARRSRESTAMEHPRPPRARPRMDQKGGVGGRGEGVVSEDDRGGDTLMMITFIANIIKILVIRLAPVSLSTDFIGDTE